MESKIIIIYQSGKGGNTKRLAHNIGKELKCDVIDVKTSPTIDLTKYDLVGFGSGIYAGHFGRAIRKYIKNLNGAKSNVCKPDAFLFSTHGGSSNVAQRRFVEFLNKKAGITTITGGSCCGKEVNEPQVMKDLTNGINTKIKPKDATSDACECAPQQTKTN